MFLSQIERIIREICHTFYQQNRDRNADVIISRFGLNGSKRETLEQIGQKYDGLTRERVRQIEAKNLLIFKSVITTGEYVKKFAIKSLPFYLNSIDPNLENEITHFIDKLKLNQTYISFNKMRELLGETFEQYQGEIELLLYCFDYEVYDTRPVVKFTLNDGFIYRDKKEHLAELLHVLNKRLDFNIKNNLEELIKQNELNISLEDAVLFVHNIDWLLLEETDKQYFITIDFNKLSTMDKAYSILQNYPSLSVDELTNKINLISNKTYMPSNVRNQMSNDSRFMPIGKSGNWAIVGTTDTKNISISDAIESVFLQCNRSLTVAEVVAGVKELRGDSFKERSVNTYLNTDERFCSLGKGQFALTKWNLPRLTKEVKRNKLVKNFDSILFHYMGLNTPHSLSQIVRLFAKNGWNEATIRQKISILRDKGAIISQTEREAGRNRTITFIKNPAEITETKEVGIIQNLQNKILAFLAAHPNQTFTKGEVYKAIDPEKSFIVQTFYQALTRIENEHLKTTKEGNKYFVTYIK